MRHHLLLIFIFSFGKIYAQSEPMPPQLILGDTPFPSGIVLNSTTIGYLLTATPNASGMEYDPARHIALAPYSLDEISIFSASVNAYLQASNTPDTEFYTSPLEYRLQIPAYTQGFFCNFEDHINKGRKLRIDFSVR